MRLSDEQLSESNLQALGKQLVSLLSSYRFDDIAKDFGYAVASGRPVAYAIRTDFSSALSDAGASGLPGTEAASYLVSAFSSNDSNLLFLIECRLSIGDSRGHVLAEIVVSNSGDERHATLEDISYVA